MIKKEVVKKLWNYIKKHELNGDIVNRQEKERGKKRDMEAALHKQNLYGTGNTMDLEEIKIKRIIQETFKEMTPNLKAADMTESFMNILLGDVQRMHQQMEQLQNDKGVGTLGPTGVDHSTDIINQRIKIDDHAFDIEAHTEEIKGLYKSVNNLCQAIENIQESMRSPSQLMRLAIDSFRLGGEDEHR